MTFNNYLLYIELIVDVFTVLFLTYLSYSFLFFTANGRKLQQRNPIDFENPFFRFALLYLITKLLKISGISAELQHINATGFDN